MQYTLNPYSELHFTCPYGSDWQTTFNITSGQDDSGNDIPVNITSWIITMNIKNSPTGTSVLSASGVIIDGANGIYTLTIDKADLANLNSNASYYYDIMEDDGGGNEFVRYFGTFTIVLAGKNKGGIC
jgi:hypothetical protein